MTAPRCIRPEELDEVLARPAVDPRRRHLTTCARCRALADAYALFVAAERAPHDASAADLVDADRRLTAAIERVAATDAPAGATAPAAPTREPERRAGLPGWLDRLLHPSLRPAWAVAAVLVAIAAISLWPRPVGRGGDVLLRRDGPAGIPVPRLERARATDDGLRLRWRSIAGAEHYEIRFYSDDLSEIARVPAGRDTTLSTDAATAAFLPDDPAATVLVRVVAYAGGDEIAASPAIALGRR